MVPLHKLVRNPRNPNKHPDEQIHLLAKIIDYQGWRNPIVVSTRSGFIVKGHARLDAAELLEVKEAPVDYQDYENEAQEWADMLADNRIAELAEMDRPELKDLLQELDTGAFDMEMTGFNEKIIEEMMTAVPLEEHDYSDGVKTDHECPKCGYKW
jgi:ParB-like chromosome segregation protein Spo0J